MVMSVLLGAVLGFLSGLGVGGGSLLLLYLTLVQHLPQSNARAINLLFFIPSALIASCFRWKQGALPLEKVLPAILAGIVCAGIVSFLSPGWDTSLLQSIFGIFLLLSGLRELLSPASKN